MAKIDPYKAYSASQQFEEETLPDFAGDAPGVHEAIVDAGGLIGGPEADVDVISLTEAELRRMAIEQLCPACPEKSLAEEERLRLYAEMDNFKKRLQREQREHARYASEKVLADMLPVLDNMELALQYGDNEASKPILIGVEMTYKVMLDALGRHGLEQVGQAGEVFDPLYHEAVGREKIPGMQPGLVGKLMHCGYKLGDRLLRPARVMVST